MKLINWVSVLLLGLAPMAQADQLEREAHEKMFGPAPRGVLVKIDPVTEIIEVFKAPLMDSKLMDKSSAQVNTTAILLAENSENKIAEFKVPVRELDKEASTAATWYCGGWGWNNWGGYYPATYNYYAPYAYPGSFSYGYYNYGYRYAYGYNNCNYGWYY